MPTRAKPSSPATPRDRGVSYDNSTICSPLVYCKFSWSEAYIYFVLYASIFPSVLCVLLEAEVRIYTVLVYTLLLTCLSVLLIRARY
jgi:hypothetical protein